MGDIIASKTGYYIWYILIFTVALFYAIGFTSTEGKYEVKMKEIEDSVVVSRAIRCFSEKNFGDIDMAKFDLENLKKCFGDSYGIIVELNKIKQSGGVKPRIEMGNVDNVREVKRYVLVDGIATRIKVSYNAA